jgi:glucokinase
VKPQKTRKALGIDFGGTSVKIGLVDECGRILEENSFATAEAASQSKWLDRVESVAADWTAKGHCLAGIGVGVPGFTDFARGFIYNLTNVPGWSSVPLAEIMRKRFALPVYVDNDVNAMALGEYVHGAGKGLNHAFFATLGTGVGGALVVNGRLYRGAYSMAGEIGHVPINMNGRKTPEGRGGLETYAGNRQIVKYALSALRRGKRSLISSLVKGDLKQITPKIIAVAAGEGDKLALEVMDYTADCLATAFASVTYLLQPEAIIVGGGVAGSGKVLFDPLRRHLRERLHKYFAERIQIIPAILGAKAGVIGCAALVFQAQITLNRER